MSQSETPYCQIRANFNDETIVVYQAFSDAIAKAALKAQTFVEPFSFNRMTWIKPSFLWMMERSNYAQSPGQENILAIRITRAGWESALRQAVLTSPQRGEDAALWARQLKAAPARVQWDPERSLRGAKLNHRSIQVGLRSTITPTYAEEWIKEIQDLSPLAKKLYALKREGEYSRAEALLPKEAVYPTPDDIAKRLGM
jgi:hypothetical protein